MAAFEKVAEGFVYRGTPGTDHAMAAGSKCAILADGEILCSYSVQAKLGNNDFVPHLSRSRDGGLSWREQGMIWPDEKNRFAIMGGINNGFDHGIVYWGARTPIDVVGESFWSDANNGLKENEVVWSSSMDSGRTWRALSVIPMPVPGSCEAAGDMCVTRTGRWIASYPPYNTFDRKLDVDMKQVIVQMSDDHGQTWNWTRMFRFEEPETLCGAGSWIRQLADGRLLGVVWQVPRAGCESTVTPFAISKDNGASWRRMLPPGLRTQTPGLLPLPDGGVILIYNDRNRESPGVRLARLSIHEDKVEVNENEMIFRPELATQSGSSGNHEQWTDFAFGMPSIYLLRDGHLLATFWCVQPSGSGIRYVKLRMNA